MKKTAFLRRGTCVLLAIIMVCTLIVPALAAPAGADEGINLKIAVLSDTHYLSPDMIKDTADFRKSLNSDRKLMTEGSAINLKLLEAVREDKPDILLISGDITKDGELEGHRDMAARLQQLQKDVPGLKVYVINGNHDVRNAGAKNYNTPDGKAVKATRTQPSDFASAYSFVYNDETVIARFVPSEGKEAGQLSYVARPCEGVTIIALDTCCYSKDNNSKGKNEHETRGAMSDELVAWATEQISAAKAKGDHVIAFSHHGFVPHFSMEPEILKIYLVDDFKKIATQFADAGLEMVFTGHMHANDIAAMTTKNGNTLYDVETGSNLTYPSPARFVQLREVGDSLVASVNTLNHVGPITYYNALTGKTETIEDLTAYGKEAGFTPEMLNTVAGTFVGKILKKFVTVETSVSEWINARIIENIQAIVTDVVNIPITEDKNLLDVANYIYQSHLGGEDDGNYPDWVQVGLDKVKSGEIVDQLLAIVKKHAFGDVASGIKFDNIFTKAVKAAMSDYIYRIAVSMGNDTNFTDDNDALIVLSGSLKAASVAVSCDGKTMNAPAIVDNGVCTVFPTRILMRELGAAGKAVTVDASASGAETVCVWERGARALAVADKVNFIAANGSMEFAAADLATGGDVYTAIASAVPNDAQKRALGNQLNTAAPFVVNATVDGKAITAPCSVTLGYKPGNEGSNTLTVVSVGDKGEIASADGRYEGGVMKCTVPANTLSAVIRFPFFDVAENAWFFGDVVYASNNSLFNGTAANTFSPDATMTRAMLVTVLWRMEGQPEAAASSFTDAQGGWYSKAVDWASANGIVNGVSSTSFAPDADVTREQMAAILFRYAGFKGVSVSARADISGFADYGSVSEYALDALSWANAEGIINGSDANTLMPRNGASRAQVAAILHRYIENCIY